MKHGRNLPPYPSEITRGGFFVDNQTLFVTLHSNTLEESSMLFIYHKGATSTFVAHHDIDGFLYISITKTDKSQSLIKAPTEEEVRAHLLEKITWGLETLKHYEHHPRLNKGDVWFVKLRASVVLSPLQTRQMLEFVAEHTNA